MFVINLLSAVLIYIFDYVVTSRIIFPPNKMDFFFYLEWSYMMVVENVENTKK